MGVNTNKAIGIIIIVILALIFVLGFPITKSEPVNTSFSKSGGLRPAELDQEFIAFFSNTPALFKEPAEVSGTILDLAATIFKSKPNIASTQPLGDYELRNKYFSRLYPKVYLDYLRENQEYLISDGWIKPESKMEFKNEDEVFVFLKSFDEYVCKASNDSALCNQDFFENSVAELKRLHTLEARIFENAGEQLLRQPQSNLWLKLRLAADWFLGIEIVRAQTLGRAQLGKDDCYQGSGLNKKIGSNLITPCCSCGLHRFGRVVVNVEDCRRFESRKCNVRNYGCLNGPGYKKNAIWDSVSKFCGFES